MSVVPGFSTETSYRWRNEEGSSDERSCLSKIFFRKRCGCRQSCNTIGRFRPELFFEAIDWRVVGHGDPICVRRDGNWIVPEPELTLVANSRGEIVGYCVGNDVSSRDIEGENPLKLPQAKMYDGSCALGPGIRIADPERFKDLPIQIEIFRKGRTIFQDQTRTSQINRPLESLTSYLMREMRFPQGVFLLTGTGIVPPDDFSLQAGDRVRSDIDSFVLENIVDA